jgi:hypothetical protein
MKRTTSGAAILAAAMALAPLPGHAQRAGGMGMGMGRGMADGPRGAGIELILRQREDLSLTDSQVQQLEQLRAESVERRTAHQAQMTEMRSKVLAGDMTREEFLEVARARREAATAVQEQQRERVEAVLDDAQEQKLEEWRGEARAYRMGRMDGMRGGRGMRSGMRGARGFRDGAGAWGPRDSARMRAWGPGFRGRWFDSGEPGS